MNILSLWAADAGQLAKEFRTGHQDKRVLNEDNTLSTIHQPQ
jgi:hypothetical protein